MKKGVDKRKYLSYNKLHQKSSGIPSAKFWREIPFYTNEEKKICFRKKARRIKNCIVWKDGEEMRLSIGLPLIIAGTAVVMDLRTARVENEWILFSLAVSFVWRVWQEGINGAFDFLMGALLPVLILGVLFYFRMLGPGDIKLFCALGGVMGPAAIGKCILSSFFLGAIISLAILIFCGSFISRIHYLICYFQNLLHTGKIVPYYRKGMVLENFHFTVPVFMSVMLYAGGVY